jgi:serine O-acetyltransferase
MFENIKNDYVRHGRSILNPAFWAVYNYRYGCWAAGIRFRPLRWIFLRFYGINLFFILITSGIRLYRETKIGNDLHLIHSGNIQVHPDTIIGDRCGIQQDVTIGINVGPGAPVIGNDVFIGAGAKILGKIKIGDGATVAANSLVISDVPPRSTAIGVPARIWKYSPWERRELEEPLSHRSHREDEAF